MNSVLYISRLKEGVSTTTLSYNFEELLESPPKIKDAFHDIWSDMLQKEEEIKITVEDAQESVKDLVLYDILDGGRTTLTSKTFVKPEDDTPLFSIQLIHTLKALGAKSCVLMVHTSYNRERGDEDLKRVHKIIRSGAELITQYCIDNDVSIKCIGMKEDYELIDVLKDSEYNTRNGSFNAYFLFDYEEEWISTELGRNVINLMPDINVYIRHTKFQPSGGWIPGKMRKAAFLYSQNGTLYSNWENDEIVNLVAMALLTKKFNEKEMLSKTYSDLNEIKQRYVKRELDLSTKIIRFRDNAKKMYILGSPVGPYQIYY